MTRTRTITLAALAAVAVGGALAIPALAQDRGAQDRGPRPGERLFQEADANRDGRVSTGEGWTALSARFARADANADGGVTWDEFRAYVNAEAGAAGRRVPTGDRASRMDARGQVMFRGLDADRDGRVTLTELRPFADAMFRARDANADGELTREEVRGRRGDRRDRPQGDRPQADRAETPPAQPAR